MQPLVTLPPAAREGSIPPCARRSAEHARALRAAERLGVRLSKKLLQRPLMSVWEATRDGEEPMALTVVDACATPKERARILEGAQAMRGMSGEGVLRIKDVREDVDAFLAERLSNGTAADLLLLRWPLLERLAFVGSVCAALEAVHAAGKAHGGLCPDNVLLDASLAPVLSEVGMVSLAESLDGDREGFFGYGAYASPEAQDGAPLDARADVFSVGKMLAYVLLEREPDEMAAADLTRRGAALGNAYRKATEPAARARHASVGELRADLERACGELTTAAPGAAPRPEAKPSAPRAPAPRAEAKPARPVAPAARAPAGPRETPRALVVAGALAAGALALGLAYLLPLPDAATTLLGLVVALGGATATIALPASGAKARAGIALAAFVSLLLLAPAQTCGVAGASRRLRAGVPAGREAVRKLLAQGDRHLGGANLAGADLSRLDLAWADLAGADLTGADLTGANLSSAILSGATLSEAKIADADLTGADIALARGVDTAKCDAATLLPRGWACEAGVPRRR